MTETLQQLVEPPTPVERLPESTAEAMTLERKKEIYNALTLTVGGVQGMARNIDRLAVADAAHLSNIDRLEREPGRDAPVNDTLSGFYGHIVDAATVTPDNECEKIWGTITEGKLTSALSNLARSYRYIKARGVLTEYTRPESGATGSYNGDAKTAPPLDTVRRPITLKQDEVEQLREAPEEDRATFLAEMLDPYRFRHDRDTASAEIAAQENEKYQAISLLESMQPSWDRDLLATEAWKYFKHPDIDEPELANRSIGLISVPELERAVRGVDEHLSEHTPDAVMERFQDSGQQALRDVERRLKLPEATRAKVAVEAAEAAEDMAVTINIPLPQLARALFDSHRLLPINETKNSGGNDNTSDEFRRQTEAGYAIYDEEAGDVLSRPVYAAVALGEDEKLHGPIGARSYGDCVVTLKPEVAKSRAAYTYGDSGNTYHRNENYGDPYQAGPKPEHSFRVMTHKEAPAAKIIFERYDPNPRRLTSDSIFDPADRYVEAQVLGGVEVDDIESITLPAKRAYEDPLLLTRIREMYPSLGVKILVNKKIAEKNQRQIQETTKKLGVEYVVVDQ